jgi:glycosyltransferase involved in cell wall biosynthesis
MKKLSIIIPYHNEDASVFRYPMSSLDTQVGVEWEDIEIIISNNCEKPKDIDSWLRTFSNIYPYIRYVECPIKAGMGQNRQYGMSIATGEYIMFSDSDDALLSPLTLHIIMEKLYVGDKDVYTGNVIRETVDETGHNKSIVDMKASTLLLHGKVYKRSFILKYNIHFSKNLFAYEDFYFNTLVQGFSANSVGNLDSGIYLWRNRQSSISNETGVGDSYSVYYYKDNIMYSYYALRHFSDNGMSEEELEIYVYNALMGMYRNRNSALMQLGLSIDMAGFIIKEFKCDLNDILEYSLEFNQSSSSTLDSYKEWLMKAVNSDTTDIFKKYELLPYEKFSY